MTRLAFILALAAALLPARTATAEEKTSCLDAHEHGQELRLAGHWVDARRLFLSCAQPTCPSLIVQDCTRWVGELAGELPTVVVAVQGPDGADITDVALSVDGTPFGSRIPAVPIPLDPGDHVLRFERAGLTPVERHVVMRDGEHERHLLVTFDAPPVVGTPLAPPPPASRPSNTWGYVALGATVALTAASVTLLVVGKVGEHNLATEPCGVEGICTDAQVDPIRGEYVASAVVAGVAAAAAAVTVWQLVTHHKDASSTANVYPFRVSF
jgi:hypothetical protein